MSLNYELPSKAREIISSEAPGDEILFSLPADISCDNRFCDGWLVATRRAIFNIENGKLRLKIDLSVITELKATGLVGNCVLEAYTSQGDIIVARSDMRHIARYSTVARHLNELIKKNDMGPVGTIEDNICPKCGRVYPNDSKICPSCINKARLLKRLWATARPHLFLLIMATLLFWVLTGIRLVQPQVTRMLVDGVLQPHLKDVNKLLLYVGLMGLLNLSSTLFSIIRGRTMVLLGSRLSKDLRSEVFAKIQALSIGYLNQRKTGDLMNRVTGDTNTVQGFIQQQAAAVINESLVLIGVGVVLFASDWRLALLVLLPTPFIVLYASRMQGTFRKIFHRQWRIWDKTNSVLQDILSGMRVVKAFGQEEKEASRFAGYSRQFADITASNEKMWNTLFPIMGFIMGLGNFLVMYYGGKLVLGHEMKIGELVQFTSYTGMIYGPLRFMTFIPRWLTEAMTATERIYEIIDQEPDVQDKDNAVSHQIEGEVTIRDIRFGYQVHEPVLQGVSLHVPKGEMIGLVGHSGAGKSTLINLLSRFYDPDEGAILIDGIDIRDISQEELRSQIGVVLQEPFLFSGTIYDNIRYAKPDATPDEVIRAAKIANAHDFIMKFPDSYDTKVGERGQRLSGGERQRIAIARAILHNPKILILDEATASVDTETEYQIQEALTRLVKDRTTFAIAHRLSTLRAADRLLVLDKGKVAEVGTHEELIRSKGLYYKLVMAQREMHKLKEVE